MKKEKGRLILISLALLMMIPLVCSPVSAGEIRVITSQGTPVDTIDEGVIENIFLGKKSTWPDGKPVEFVVLKSGDTHDAFLAAYVKKSSAQFVLYWKTQVFTGKGKSPRFFDSESDLVAYVAGKDGVIGYVSAATDIAGAKVLNKK